MNLTPNFTVEEMERSSTAIRMGLSNVCPDELKNNMREVAEVLEVIRSHFNAPIHITSCYRSPDVNRAVGGSKTSAHRFAHAADFEVAGQSNLEVCKWVAENIKGFDQIIYEFGEEGWCHLGLTNGDARGQLLSAVKENGKTVYHNGLG